MILNLTLLAATCGLLAVSRHQPAFSPVRMFLYGWLLVAGTAVSGLVRYERQLAVSTFLIVLATLCAFFAGAYFARGPRGFRKSPVGQTPGDFDRPFGRPRDDFDRQTIFFLCALASVGALYVIIDLLGGGFALLTNFATTSSRTRTDYWAAFAAGEVGVSPVRSIGIVSCLIVATLLPYATRYRRRLLQVASAVAAIVVVVDSFLSAGRFSLGVLALCLLVSATLVYGGEAVRRVFTVRRLVIGGALAFYFFVVFPVQRNPALPDSVDSLLSFLGDSYLPGWVKNIAAYPGMSWFEILAYSTSYFSGSLDKLNYFVTETDVFSWYQLGLYNITQFSQISGAISDDVTPWHQTRLDIGTLMSAEGWSFNPWSTGIRDLGIDFGLFAVPIIGILGFVAQRSYDKSVESRSYVGLVTATYVSVACVIFAIISPFQVRIISNGFWLLGIIVLIRAALANRASTRRPQSRRFLHSPPQ